MSALLASRRASMGLGFLVFFGLAAVGVGAARAITTTFVPVLLDRIDDAPFLIGLVMLVNAVAGFAVPLAVGVWSDRSKSRMGPRMPYVIGGSVLTLGGLLAVALGAGTSYLVLALASGLVYAGLNATATAHRALIPDGFDDSGRPAATSAQEVAMLVGAMAGIGAGGVLLSIEPWLPFAVAGLLVPLTAAPTVVSLLRRGASGWSKGEAQEEKERHSVRLADFTETLRHPGAREVLIAQVLWVIAYIALPTFFILYADDVLGLSTGAAAAIPAAFGLLTGAAMVVAGRTRPEQVRGRLMLGATLLGAGLLAAFPLSSIATVAVPFAVAAVGAGLVTALGFPYFARFIPEGNAGRYSGVFFASRAIAAVVALPLAGLLAEVTGSYRYVLIQGALALLAPLVLARVEPARAGVRRSPIGRVAAVVPCYGVDRIEEVVGQLHPHAEQIVLVDDGAPCEAAERIDALAGEPGVRVLRLPRNDGKGSAVAAGTELLLACPEPPDAIAVVDADGQHPAGRLPDFLAALEDADVVIGDRMGDVAAMPWQRRMTNRVSSALLGMVLGRRLRDSQCGMRVFRTEALEQAPPPPGRYEAETRHLKALVRSGQRLAWVPIPAIYGSAHSSFRPVRDSARVLAAIFGRRTAPARPHRPGRAFWRQWSVRLGALVAGTMAVGAAMPLLGPLDERAFLSINGMGDGPEWLYEALDPHTRNYILLVLAGLAAVLLARKVTMWAAALALVAAAFFSDMLLQAVYILYERPRPEEVLGEAVMLTHDRTWAHIASFPSGHLTVTTAIVVAAVMLAPMLRGPLWGYVAVVAVTRITFGAHFPADVVVGIVFGYVSGVFSVALVQAAGLLPRDLPSPSPLPERLRTPVREGWGHVAALRR